jgi:hypothetical protein
MSVAQLDKALLELLDLVSRKALQTLLFDPVEPEELDWHLTRLSHRVAPAYLPFAADDSGVLAVHLWPGRDVADSPFVYVGEDQLELHYLCDGLHNLPATLWLWMGRYFKKGKMPALREAVAEMAARIPGGQPVPDTLWPLLESAPDYEPTWWHADATETTTRAWQLAEVGHPFVGLPKPDYLAKPEEAIALLEPFMHQHREPELVSALLAAQIKAGQQVEQENVLLVLAAEAWRQSEGVHLEVRDIDSDRMMVHVRHGKGSKDRYVPLPAPALKMLRRYWCRHRHPKWLFPAPTRLGVPQTTAAKPMSISGLQRAFKAAVEESGIQKEVTVHTLRHCQNGKAAEWLEKQVDLLPAANYFMLTFTLPDELRRVARSNQKLCYDLLFRTSADAIQKLAQDSRFVGGRMGMVGVLHTLRQAQGRPGDAT